MITEYYEKLLSEALSFPSSSFIQKYRHPRAYNTLNEEFLKLTAQEVQELQGQINDYNREIRKVRLENDLLAEKIRSSVEEILEVFGVNQKKRSGNWYAVNENFVKQLVRQIHGQGSHPVDLYFSSVRIGNEDYRVPFSPCNLYQLWDHVNKRVQKDQEKADKADKVLVASIEYLVRRMISIGDLSNDEIKSLADRMSREQVEKDALEQDDMPCDCDECGDWTPGERRCDCGNRRIALCIDGNIVDGYTAYAEAH